MVTEELGVRTLKQISRGPCSASSICTNPGTYECTVCGALYCDGHAAGVIYRCRSCL